MNVALHFLQSYATMYLEDVIIHSPTWQDHLFHLGWVLQKAELTANYRKVPPGADWGTIPRLRYRPWAAEVTGKKVEVVCQYPPAKLHKSIAFL